MEVNPAEIPELHKRAAIWFEQNGNLDDAFRHALASRDMAWAADMIERNLQRMMKTGEISALTQWMEQTTGGDPAPATVSQLGVCLVTDCSPPASACPLLAG